MSLVRGGILRRALRELQVGKGCWYFEGCWEMLGHCILGFPYSVAEAVKNLEESSKCWDIEGGPA